MKGKFKRTHRVLLPCILCVLFFVFTIGVIADGNYSQTLFSVLQIEDNKVGNQSAQLIDALSIDGLAHSDSGIIAPSSTSTDAVVPLLTALEDGSTCIGDCAQVKEVPPENIPVTATTTTSDNEDLPATTTVSVAVASTSTSTSLVADLEQATVTDTVVTSKNTEQDSSSASSGGSSRSSSSVVATTSTSTISTSTASSTDPTEEIEEVTSPTPDQDRNALSEEEILELPFLEQFTYRLSRTLFIVGDKIGINNPNPQFALSVKGWLYASKGFLVGPADRPVGFGTTFEGICLGSCDFDIPALEQTVDTDIDQTSNTSEITEPVISLTSTSSTSTTTTSPDTTTASSVVALGTSTEIIASSTKQAEEELVFVSTSTATTSEEVSDSNEITSTTTTPELFSSATTSTSTIPAEVLTPEASQDISTGEEPEEDAVQATSSTSTNSDSYE